MKLFTRLRNVFRKEKTKEYIENEQFDFEKFMWCGTNSGQELKNSVEEAKNLEKKPHASQSRST